MNRTLAVEYILSLSITSWAAIKNGKLPWPPTVVYTSVAFGILSFAALFDETFAELLGGGFLLAQLVKMMSGTSKLPDAIYSDLSKNIIFKDYAIGFDGTIGGSKLASG